MADAEKQDQAEDKMREIEDRIAILGKQESVAQFPNFSEETAFDLGSALYGIVRAKRLPVVVNIRTADRALFHAAMPGATPDNDHWVRRKSNIVLRFHQSSLLYGQMLASKGKVIDDDLGMTLSDYAPHGGSFPIRVKKSGVVAAITVSGLPQLDDHRMVIDALSLYLKLEIPTF